MIFDYSYHTLIPGLIDVRPFYILYEGKDLVY